MRPSKLISIVFCLSLISCGKNDEVGTSTVVARPVMDAKISYSAPILTKFMVVAKSTEDAMTLTSGKVFYTTDGTVPNTETGTAVDLDLTNAVHNGTGDSALSSNLPVMTSTTTLKYIAILNYTQKVKKKSGLSQKESTENISSYSIVDSATFTITGTGTGDPITANTPTLAGIQMVTLDHTSCILVSVQLYGTDNGLLVKSDSLPVVITLTQSSGQAGTFYTSSDCTTGSLTTGSVSTVTIPAKLNNASVYFHGPTSNTYNFSESWSCGAESGTGLSANFFL